MQNDFAALCWLLEHDYAGHKRLKSLTSYQQAKAQLQTLFLTADSVELRQRILAALLIATGDRHLHLEPLPHGVDSENKLYAHHFTQLYQRNGRAFGQSYHHAEGDAQSPSVNFLDEDTTLITVSGCAITHAAMLAQLLSSLKKQIVQHPYMIIDIRGNHGGSDRIWQHLWPYLATAPLMSNGTAFWASVGNQRYLEHGVHYAKLLNRPDDAHQHGAVVRAMVQHHGSFVFPKLPGFHPYCEADAQVKAVPRRCAVIIDGKTASAGETLIELARTSEKTTVFGQSSSRGSYDCSNLRLAWLPTGQFCVSFGMSLKMSAGYAPVDGSGFRPDVVLPQGSALRVLPLVQAYLRQEWHEVARLHGQF